ncbi:MAG: VanZ family protein, partial [Thermoanaerobaculia bacterium]
VVHFVLFSVMAWLAYLAFRDVAALRFPVLAACGFALAYGLILEGLQFYIPERFPSFADALADGFGALAAGLVSDQVERRIMSSLST